MALKPLIIGMNNPQGNEPLWPDPPGCAGWRLWKMLEQETGASKRDYLRAFDRMNLCDGSEWSMIRARKVMADIMHYTLPDRRLVFLGNQVWAAYSRMPPRPFIWLGNRAVLPHPSGRNRLYNDPAVYLCAVYFLAELYRESVDGKASA